MMGGVLLVVVVSLLLGTPVSATLGSEWSYKGVSTWPLQEHQCGGHRQSPIDFTTVEAYSNVEPFTFINYEMTDVSLMNNGHSLNILLPDLPLKQRPRVTGGGLGATYVLDSFHFHWGSTSHRGSEHRLNGCAFDGEMHLVHVKEQYETVSEALKHEDGLAVLGVWLTQDNTRRGHVFNPNKPLYKAKVERPAMRKEPKHRPNNHAHNWLFDLTPTRHGTQTAHAHVILRQLLPEDVHAFYRYKGSLTTPPCTENVLWTVMATPVKTPSKFLRGLRALVNPDTPSNGNNNHLEDTNGASLSDNFRPTQSLWTRKVFYSGVLAERPTTCDP